MRKVTITKTRTYKLSVEVEMEVPEHVSDDNIETYLYNDTDYENQLEKEIDRYPPEESDCIKDETEYEFSINNELIKKDKL